MRTKGGTEGVGRSATTLVVLCSPFVILADVFLVSFVDYEEQSIDLPLAKAGSNLISN
jgi:hypothetical protein